MFHLSSCPRSPQTNICHRRSFVPPVRDEEHEIQRKAHAKRVRETRRSTQGVTLEDLKSAEQLVKKKQQQENAQRTTELQQLASPAPASPALPGSTASTTVTTSATLVAGSDADKQERRPSWRLRMESSDKNRVSINLPTSQSDVEEKLKMFVPPCSVFCPLYVLLLCCVVVCCWPSQDRESQPVTCGDYF